MTHGAIVARLRLAVATDTRSHGVLDRLLGDRHRSHIAVAVGALDLGADVRGVPELDVCSAFEAVHPLPGHLTFPVPILDQQLYTRSFVGDPLVAQHALVDRRDRRRGTYVSSAVAVDAVDTRRHVFIVRELDWLLLAPKYPAGHNTERDFQQAAP